jgi:hypothetical protein
MHLTVRATKQDMLYYAHRIVTKQPSKSLERHAEKTLESYDYNTTMHPSHRPPRQTEIARSQWLQLDLVLLGTLCADCQA